MADTRLFPRLRQSPSTPSEETFRHETSAAQPPFRSLPNTPRITQTHRHSIPGAPAYWSRRRNDRRQYAELLLMPRTQSANAQMATYISDLYAEPSSNKTRECLKTKRNDIRAIAKDVGWSVGTAGTARTVLLSPLASVLRTTNLDEDDLIDEYLAMDGRMSLGDLRVLDFERIRQITVLRQTLRMLVRVQHEYPNPTVRENAHALATMLNGKKYRRRIPMPRPLRAGPSFFYAPQKFEILGLLSQVEAQGGADDYDSFDDDSDYEGNMPKSVAISSMLASARGSHQHQWSSDALRALSMEASPGAHADRYWMKQLIQSSCEQWNCSVPHVVQLLSPLPECGVALLETINHVFDKQHSVLTDGEAYYLFAAGAAQVGCYPLVATIENKIISSFVTDHYDDDSSMQFDDAHMTHSPRIRHNFEHWISGGLRAASYSVQLLAQFGERMARRPMDLGANDVRQFVSDYVDAFYDYHSIPGRARGGSGDNLTGTTRSTGHRSFSTSIMTGGFPVSPAGGDLPRKSVEEQAIRDLMHAIVALAVAHGLGSFASACGLTPDLDTAAGTHFGALAGLVPEEQLPGVPPQPGSLGFAASDDVHVAGEESQLSASLVERAERNTHELIDRLSQSSMQHIGHTSADHIASGQSLLPSSLSPPLSAASMMRRISGPDAKHISYMQKLDYIDPLLRPESQFVAYRQMRDKKLAKYRLSLDDQLSGRRSSTPLQLSHRHELRWDTLSDALRQRLGMQLDILGDETQKARSITGRALTESPTNAVPVQETPGIVTLEEKLSAFHHSNSYDSEGGAIDDVVGMGPRDYNQASTLPMYAENSSSERLQQNRHIDARQFHDAIWHFTLGQFNIYEELYYYRKYCSDAECQSTIPAQLRRPTPAYTQDLTAVEMVMDLDLDADRYTSLQTQHPSHWINDELKAHIRAVLWNPSGISATSAQPPVAAALNLSTEEMVRINLIISLARRQAEIIHAMRALYEYENPSRN